MNIRNAEQYLDTFKSENTRLAAITVIKKMEKYIGADLDQIKMISKEEIDTFMKEECNGKSETTISNNISRMKHLCGFYENDAANHLNLRYVKTMTDCKEAKFLTSYEVYQLIESLANYQDKVLVLLIYLGLYDNDLETIRNLKSSQFKDGILYLENEEIHLNEYCSKIVLGAINETSCEKYIFCEGRKSNPYPLRETEYILKVKERKNVPSETIPSMTLKKRFDVFARVSEIEGLSAIVVKNSKYIYDLVKLEYDVNGGIDINQIELENYCKDANMRGSIGKLNISKKKLKNKLIEEMVNGKDMLSPHFNG